MPEKDQQLTLLDDEISALAPELQVTARKHSAAFLRRDNPRLVKAIELMVSLGISDQHISDACEVSPNVVAAIRFEGIGPLSVEDHKKRVMSGLERLSLGIIQRMIQALEGGEEIPFKDLAIAKGIITEKLELLRGNATHRVEQSLSPEERALRELLLRPAAPRMVFPAESSAGNATPDHLLPPPSPGLVIDLPRDDKSPEWMDGNKQNQGLQSEQTQEDT